jgi:Asp-tRNA(Asn)/Glu-tRNA(Gln) amidotransferase A subunit family amidase
MNGDVDLCYLTAAAAIDLFARRKLSPRELMAAVIRRIEVVNPAINALGDRFLDEAKTAAATAEHRWSTGTTRPLEGIPVAVKDAQQVAGQRTTYGSPVYRANIAQYSDPMIERLLAAGAIIHSRTTVSEFCVSGVCTSPMWGTTRNPWNALYSPGGSSGGSAAALAAGMTLLATGTDMGGSIRVPASACGVVGYKPPHGRNPDGAPFNVDRFCHCGPLARSVGDAALMQNIVSGQHASDHDSLREVVVLPTEPANIAGMRVAWSPDLSYRAVDPEVRTNTEQALSVLAGLGCVVEEVEVGWTEEVDRIAAGWYRSSHTGRMIAAAAAEAQHLVSSDLLKLAASSQAEFSLAEAFGLISAMSTSLSSIMEGHDVFICPTMTVAAVRADQSMWDTDFKIDGVTVDPEFGYSTTHQFNVLSNCPALSVPSGRTSFGVPTGLQIVGHPYDDATVFRVALAFEAAAGPWFSSPEGRP